MANVLSSRYGRPPSIYGNRNVSVIEENSSQASISTSQEEAGDRSAVDFKPQQTIGLEGSASRFLAAKPVVADRVSTLATSHKPKKLPDLDPVSDSNLPGDIHYVWISTDHQSYPATKEEFPENIRKKLTELKAQSTVKITKVDQHGIRYTETISFFDTNGQVIDSAKAYIQSATFTIQKVFSENPDRVKTLKVKQFLFFPRLPLEVQLHIWKYAAHNDPRIIRAHWEPEDASLTDEHKTLYRLSAGPLPSILEVTRSSRHEALKYYVPVKARQPFHTKPIAAHKHHVIYVNFEIDTLYFLNWASEHSFLSWLRVVLKNKDEGGVCVCSKKSHAAVASQVDVGASAALSRRTRNVNKTGHRPSKHVLKHIAFSSEAIISLKGHGHEAMFDRIALEHATLEKISCVLGRSAPSFKDDPQPEKYSLQKPKPYVYKSTERLEVARVGVRVQKAWSHANSIGIHRPVWELATMLKKRSATGHRVGRTFK